MEDNPRQQLLDLARHGDQAALGDLLEQFRPYVRVLVHAIWHRQASARQDDSDLIQDTMLMVHQAFSGFRGTSVAEFAGWLRAITLRTAGHAVRSHVATGKRGLSREEVLPDLGQIALPESRGADEEVSRHEQAALVAAALERLPADMQQVLRGRMYDGSSYAELSTRMRRTQGALRVLYTRALRRLGEELPAGTRSHGAAS